MLPSLGVCGPRPPRGERERVLSADEIIERTRAHRTATEVLELERLHLALAWADAHRDPGPDGAGEVDRDADSDHYGLPVLRWDAAAPFAAALGVSTTAGRGVLRDALTLRHRLPRLWQRVDAGDVPARKARLVAQRVMGEPDDVVAFVDLEVAQRAGAVGPVTLDRIIDAAVLRLHAEERELDQLDALDSCHATLDLGSVNHTGIVDMHLRGDLADLAAFDDALSAVAHVLADHEDHCHDSFDQRRARAVGILADPAHAAVLLATTATGEVPERRARRTRAVFLAVHLTPENLLGVDPVVLDSDDRAHLDLVVRDWCGRDDVHLTVQPVLAPGTCDGRHERTRHDPTAAQLTEVQLRDGHCVFPHCTRPARLSDCDHIQPWQADESARGPTCPCNLAVLCRHHHRLKTHAGWRYTQATPGTYLWRDPHGQSFLVSRAGTTDLTDALTPA